ncbi:hypothetical protein LUZ62_079326 [Rhynchospora pubera]|uniref:Uncharacterized protein n=1 Tax=Rhynchospora pubera TaxID=906938 RepID=A0AAV8DP22_9POAL|nr:hypothetical protein LUZ62_079326 [Rhynchospora pubera]
MSLPLFFILILTTFSFLLSPAPTAATARTPQTQKQSDTPTPAPWPEQFHALLFMNYSNSLSMIDLWYDWPRGRNFNIIHDQLAHGGPPLFNLEWNNGTSFFYTLQEPLRCRSAQLDVGVLRPNWLDGATYLGRAHVNGFLCDAWTKADFIWYYQDVESSRPVKWVFYTGRTAHVMTFEVGAVLDDAAWQAPVYCFHKNDTDTTKEEQPQKSDNALTINHNRLIQHKKKEHHAHKLSTFLINQL